MPRKKKQVEENYDRIEWLKNLYAEWKERQLLNKPFESKEQIVAEPFDLYLEGHWQSDFLDSDTLTF